MKGPLVINWTDEEGGGDEFRTIIGNVPEKNVVTGKADVKVSPNRSFTVTETSEPAEELPEA